MRFSPRWALAGEVYRATDTKLSPLRSAPATPDSVNSKSLHLPYRHCTVMVTGVFKAPPQLSQA